jgi:hypothetical protein
MADVRRWARHVSALLRNPKIAARIETLKAKVADRSTYCATAT